MSDLQNKLVVALPMLVIAGLFCWFLGKNDQETPQLNSTRQERTDKEPQRYHLAAKTPTELTLPKLKFDFLEREIEQNMPESMSQDESAVQQAVFDTPAEQKTFPALSTEILAPGSRSKKNRFHASDAIGLKAPPAATVELPSSETETESTQAQQVSNQESNEDSLHSVLIKSEVPVEMSAVPVEKSEVPVEKFEVPVEMYDVPLMTSKVSVEIGSESTNVETATPSKETEKPFEPVPELPELPQPKTQVTQFPRVADAGDLTTFAPARSANPRDPVQPQLPQPVEVVVDNSSEYRNTTLSENLNRAIKSQIRQRLDYAGSLARRGAFSSAEEIYFQVVRLIAETKDSHFGGRDHTLRLANALTAFEEAEDFITEDLRARVRMNVQNVVASHNTPILQEFDCTDMTSINALQRYYEYAGEELVNAAGDEPIASEALYNLGKLYSTQSRFNPADAAMQNAKSMIIHQAALASDPQNHLAGNELGVLLARYGRLQESREILIHSVSVSPESATWRNLSIVHQQLGETKLAQLAKKEFELSANQPASATKKQREIQWVDHETFEKVGGKRDDFAKQALQEVETTKTDSGQQAASKDKASDAQKPAATVTRRQQKEWWQIFKKR